MTISRPLRRPGTRLVFVLLALRERPTTKVSVDQSLQLNSNFLLLTIPSEFLKQGAF